MKPWLLADDNNDSPIDRLRAALFLYLLWKSVALSHRRVTNSSIGFHRGPRLRFGPLCHAERNRLVHLHTHSSSWLIGVLFAAPLTYNACKYSSSTILLQIFQSFFGNRQSVDFKDHPFKAGNIPHVFLGELEEIRVAKETSYDWKHVCMWGFICGLGDAGAAIFQQMGLVNVSADKTSFIIGMYVVLVPVVTWLVPALGEGEGEGAVSFWSWISIGFSMVGLYLLSGCAEEQVCVGGAMGQGELLVFISMLFWVVSMCVVLFPFPVQPSNLILHP